MNYLPFTIFAYFLNAVSVTVDKSLLKKIIPNPLTYVFYISLLSLLVLIFIPFTHIPTSTVFILAGASTLLWSLGAFFMFKALKEGLVSRVIPVIGTLTPIFLLIHAAFFSTVSINQTWAAGFLISGLIFLTLSDLKGKILVSELVLEVLAAAFFAISYLLLREAYIRADFLTVLAWSKVILLPILVVFLFPQLRKKISTQSGNPGILFIGGQLAGGTSQFLLTFSISLATPALVNSLAGVQYIFLLVFGYFLFKEKPGRLNLAGKLVGIIAVFAGLFILSFPAGKTSNFGVTYSPLYAIELGLNPTSTFTNMLDELKIKQIRLPVYWSEIEKFPLQFNFGGLDFYINEASKRDVKVILVVGLKQPRWPECFAPEWVTETTDADQEKRILDLVQREITHFKQFKNIYAWQIENEPFFFYGDCEKITKQTKSLVEKEIKIVRSLDNRPVLITDSGELSSWVEAISLADIFGHTLYREVWNPVLGTRNYPLPPVFYSLKADFIKFITGKNPQIITSELQAEPWLARGKHTSEVSPQEEARLFPVSKLASNIAYARETGEKDIYLWGVEWWYYMQQNDHPEYLEFAKTLFKVDPI